MSTKILTIAIPTYNRSAFLETQLKFLSKELSEFDEDYEIFISDNCSTDNTIELLQRYQSDFKPGCFRYSQNPENLGVVKNIANCINSATGKYVWVCSDDDNLFEGCVAKVIANLKASPHTGLQFLNCSYYEIDTDTRITDGFKLEDKEFMDGKSIFEEIFTYEGGWGALILTTALVYRTDLAKQSILKWPEGLDCIMYQLYITAFCAFHGSMRTTKDIYFEYVQGRSFYSKVRDYFIKMHYVDKPRIYNKLLEMGLSPRLCKRNVIWMFAKSSEWIVALKLVVRRPGLTLKSMANGFPYVVKILTTNSNSVNPSVVEAAEKTQSPIF